MATISFKMSEVKKLADELNACKKYKAIASGDFFNPEFYPDGKVVDEKGRGEDHSEFIWPDASKIIQERIPPQLVLVKDQSIYLITNCDLPDGPAKRGTVCYANGFDPDKVDFDDWYDRARDVMGGDDNSIPIPAGWFELAEKRKKRSFSLNIGKTQISLRL